MLKQFLKLTYSKLSKFELPLHPEECDGVDDDQSMYHLDPSPPVQGHHQGEQEAPDHQVVVHQEQGLDGLAQPCVVQVIGPAIKT